jgi:hypothetical protein
MTGRGGPSLAGTEPVHFEVLFGDIDVGRWRSREGGLAKDLSVQRAREQLDADFVTFS